MESPNKKHRAVAVSFRNDEEVSHYGYWLVLSIWLIVAIVTKILHNFYYRPHVMTAYEGHLTLVSLPWPGLLSVLEKSWWLPLGLLVVDIRAVLRHRTKSSATRSTPARPGD